MKTRTPNPGFDATINTLIAAGYTCGSSFERVKERGYLYPETHFEIWVGRKGCVIVQEWKDGNGCDLYTNWGTGHTQETLKEAL